MPLIHWLGRPFRWLFRHKERIAIVGTGHLFVRVEIILLDHFLYGAVSAYLVLHYGLAKGSLFTFLAMTPSVVIVNYLYLKFYDWLKKDWLGIEALKELRDGTDGGWWMRVVRAIARKGAIPTFVAGCIYAAAFQVTVYFRHKSQGYRMTSRDWKIFWAAALFSNAYWALRWSAIVWVISEAWNLAT